MKIEVWKAAGDDVEWLAETCRSFTAYHLKEEYDEWVSDSRHRVFVAKYEGKNIGYMLLIRQSYSWMMMETVYVQPEYRRCGIARMLLEFAKLNLPEGVNFLTVQLDLEKPALSRVAKWLGFTDGPPHRWMYMELKKDPERKKEDQHATS